MSEDEEDDEDAPKGCADKAVGIEIFSVSWLFHRTLVVGVVFRVFMII